MTFFKLYERVSISSFFTFCIPCLCALWSLFVFSVVLSSDWPADFIICHLSRSPFWILFISAFRWPQQLNRDQPRWGHVSSDPSLSHQPVISSRSGAGIAAIFVSIQLVILEPCEPLLWMTKMGMRCQCVCVCLRGQQHLPTSITGLQPRDQLTQTNTHARFCIDTYIKTTVLSAQSYIYLLVVTQK